jgi:hypothetical protein
MTPPERQAVAWAVELLGCFFALTGMEPNPDSRQHFARLREMARGPAAGGTNGRA